jgi:hypothetical protein
MAITAKMVNFDLEHELLLGPDKPSTFKHTT